MRTPRGVSLVEVLVASVLLAVGVSGTLSSLSAAARLRHGASGREALAAAVHDRLGWFEVAACTVADSSATEDVSGGVRVQWDLRSTPDGRTLELDARAPWAARSHRLHLRTAVPCPAD